MMLGSDPRLLHDELLMAIREGIRAHPRTLQRRIGPSEMGTPCLRKMGYRLLDVDPCQGSESWLPTVGTAVHAWLAEQFALTNLSLGFTRYLIEHTVSVGTVGGVEVTGTADLYDRVTATVIDWKVVGAARLAVARSRSKDRIGNTYRVQANLYGRGFRAKGLPVERVTVAFLPRNGQLTEAVFVTEDHDPELAEEALKLADATAVALQEIGADLLQHMPTADDYCISCSWFAPYSTTPATGCAGHQITLDPSAIAEGIILPD
jgi:hypothetical protein